MSVFLPSLPSIADHFGVQYSVAQLAVTAYLITSAFVQLVMGPLSDRFGRRPVALCTILVFIMATLLSIYAPNFELFLLGRIIQAMAVVGLAVSRAAVRDMYDANKAASMIGFVTMGMAVVPTIGPAIGGVLQESFGWQMSFWLLFGAGVIVFILVYLDFGETNQNRSASIMAQFRQYPELFRSRRFWAYCLSATSAVAAYFCYLVSAPLVGQGFFGMSPKELGFYFGAPAVGYFIGNFLTGMFAQKAGINRMIFFGTLIAMGGMTLSLCLFLFTETIPLSFFGCVTLVGIGNGMTLPNASTGMMSVRPSLAGTASGIGGTMMTAAGAGLASAVGAYLNPAAHPEALIFIMLLASSLPIFGLWYITKREDHLNSANS